MVKEIARATTLSFSHRSYLQALSDPMEADYLVSNSSNPEVLESAIPKASNELLKKAVFLNTELPAAIRSLALKHISSHHVIDALPSLISDDIGVEVFLKKSTDAAHVRQLVAVATKKETVRTVYDAMSDEHKFAFVMSSSTPVFQEEFFESFGDPDYLVQLASSHHDPEVRARVGNYLRFYDYL